MASKPPKDDAKKATQTVVVVPTLTMGPARAPAPKPAPAPTPRKTPRVSAKRAAKAAAVVAAAVAAAATATAATSTTAVWKTDQLAPTPPEDEDKLGFSECVVCGEINAGSSCGGEEKHLLCAACVKACAMCAAKTQGTVIGDALCACPVEDCSGFISGAAPDHHAAPRRIVRLVKLRGGEADAALETFKQPMKGAKSLDVFRVENPALLAIYEACKMRLNKVPAGANETMVFHGTDRGAAGSICREGFDIRRSGSVHGQVLGAGVYLAEVAKVSDGYTKVDATGRRCMFHCRALLGTVGRDCVAGGNGVFVVAREQQIYPAFVIYYS